jgi:hypothetical protein
VTTRRPRQPRTANVLQALPFRAWLHRQRHRQDPIGDIARDIAEDRCAAGLGTRQLRHHIEHTHDAIPAALDAYDRALQEWRTTR